MKNAICKTLTLSLNALAIVVTLGACTKEVKLDVTGGGPYSPTPSSNELMISQNPSDGLYNSFEAADASVNEAEKIFFHTPLSTTKIQFGGSAISVDGCSISNIQTTLDILKYDGAGNIIHTQRLDFAMPDATLEPAFKYGVRAKLTGTQGCRSVFLSFTISKT